MMENHWKQEKNLTMLLDFYELTMANGYFKLGTGNQTAVFDMFFRKIPDQAGFAICAGLEQLIDYFENLHFTKEDIEYLRSRGMFDEAFLDYRGCAALKLANDPICCSLSINHRLAFREKLKITDLYGETVMLIKRGWNKYTDAIRDELWSEHPQIKIIDVPFLNAEVFNKCESENNILIDFGNGGTVHPLLKRVPIDWDYTIPFGILHSPKPSETVSEFLEAVSKVYSK